MTRSLLRKDQRKLVKINDEYEVYESQTLVANTGYAFKLTSVRRKEMFSAEWCHFDCGLAQDPVDTFLMFGVIEDDFSLFPKTPYTAGEISSRALCSDQQAWRALSAVGALRVDNDLQFYFRPDEAVVENHGDEPFGPLDILAVCRGDSSSVDVVVNIRLGGILTIIQDYWRDNQTEWDGYTWEESTYV